MISDQLAIFNRDFDSNYQNGWPLSLTYRYLIAFGGVGSLHGSARMAYRQYRDVPMRTIATALVLGLCTAANAANPSMIEGVVKDRYFLTAQCDKYLTALSVMEQTAMTEASETMVRDEVIRYVSGRDSLVPEFKKAFDTNGVTINPSLEDGRKKLQAANQPFIAGYEDESYDSTKLQDSYRAWKAIETAPGRTKDDARQVRRFLLCRTATTLAGRGVLGRYHEKYISYALSKVRKATIGYFEVSADKGEYGPVLGTGNRYAEPKSWPGSRFFTVYATFKNIDTESRQPFEGSLLINYNGKEYVFDSVEPISLEGYNIWFRAVNPLVAMKTKIVYRIPDEISGEVYWRPGRNSDSTRLWLGFVKAAKKNGA